jgi:hypothetical protein
MKAVARTRSSVAACSSGAVNPRHCPPLRVGPGTPGTGVQKESLSVTGPPNLGTTTNTPPPPLQRKGSHSGKGIQPARDQKTSTPHGTRCNPKNLDGRMSRSVGSKSPTVKPSTNSSTGRLTGARISLDEGQLALAGNSQQPPQRIRDKGRVLIKFVWAATSLCFRGATPNRGSRSARTPKGRNRPGIV